MANNTWKLTTGGDWDTAADWSSGVTPVTADAVSINTTAVATITHAIAVSDAIASLSTAAADTLWVSAGSLTVSGAAALAGAVAISGGRLTLDGASTMASLTETGGVLSIAPSAALTISGADTLSGGTVSGGTLATSGATTLSGGATLSGLTWRDAGSLVALGGTLSGVTYDGVLGVGVTAGATNQYLFVAGGLTLKNAGGTGPGTATLGSANSYGALVFENSQTVDNATINLVSSSSGRDGSIEDEDTTGLGGNILTLGGALTVNSSGVATNYIGYSPGVGHEKESIVNAGAINVTSGALDIIPDHFTNTGTINVTAGALNINSADSFTNTGTIWVGSGVTFYLNTDVTPGSMAGIGGQAGAMIVIDGTVNNTGAVFGVAPGASFVLGNTGTIDGGTIVDPSGLLGGVGGTLSGVTYDGTLDLGATAVDSPNQYLFVTGGLTLHNAAGTGNGAVTLGGAEAYGTLVFEDTETVDNATINLVGGAGHYGAIEGNGTTVTLGGGLTVNSSGAGGNYIGDSSDNIVNAGTINVTSGTLLIQTNSFTNTGAINVTAGTLYIEPTSFTNSGAIMVSSGATLTIETGVNQSIQTLNTSVTLSGTGSVFEVVNPSSGVASQIDTSLTRIGASGALILLANRGLTNTSAFSDSGLLQLGGGTFNTDALTVATTGTILGYGAVTSAVTNNGLIEAKGGKLTVTRALTGTGTTQIDAGATLELAAASAEAVSFGGAVGTLKLDSPSSFTGVIGGLAAGDVIDLVGATTTGLATLSGTVLRVPTGGGTLTFNFASAPAGAFSERSDGSTGTDLVFGGHAAATLTTGVDHVTQNNVVISAAANTLSAGDVIKPGGTMNTLQLTGGGTFDLRQPKTLTGVGVLDVTEGVGTAKPSIWLRNGLNLVVNVTSGGTGARLRITGADDSSTINLGSGTDSVVLGAATETVNGGAGTDTYFVNAATIGATINGGAGRGTLWVTGGGTVTMGSNITNIETVILGRGTVFTANGLNLRIIGSGEADTIQAGSGSDVISPGGGADTLIGGSGSDIFEGLAQHLATATLENFTASDTIDITNLKFSTTKPTTVAWAANVLTVTQGAIVEKIHLVGSYTGTFSTKTDGANGVDITYAAAGGGGSVPGFAQAMASFGATESSAGALVAATTATPTPTLLAAAHI